MVRYSLSDSSAVSLLASNILVITMAVTQQWDLSTVLWVYWIQSVVIGFFQFLRILSLKHFSTENFYINDQPVSPTPATKIFTAFFFLFHYGIFHLVYAGFLAESTRQMLDFSSLFIGGSIFFVNHLFSFYHNRIHDEKKLQNIGTVMFAPYARIIPMHLIIIFGSMLGPTTLFIFLILKTVVDLIAHTIKHNVTIPVSTNIPLPMDDSVNTNLVPAPSNDA